MDNSEWRKLQKKWWPEGSFSRAFPGAKGILEVFEKAKRSNYQTAAQPMEEPPVTDLETYYLQARRDVESHFTPGLKFEGGFLSSKNYLDELKKNLKTQKDVDVWRTGWITLLKSLKRSEQG